MAINFLLKRSNTASKRPTAAQLDIGELSLNYEQNTCGVYFEDSNGDVRKVGPVEVSASAPNATPAGSSGNSLGELWYDTGTSNLKIWTGASFVSATSTVAAGGSDTQVQFNSTGSLSGSANFTFDGTTASIAGLVITGTSTFRAAATQDGIKIEGRAGGTSDYDVTIIPTTLSANRMVTLADGDTTLQAGTMAITGGKLSQFAATTSAELAGVISDETGTGALVFASSPSLTTPSLGVASAASINKVTITAPATGSTLTIADGKTLTASNTLTFTGTDSSSVAFGTGGTVAYTGGTLAQFAATTSSQLAGVISDETGSGALVFGTSPAITTSLTTPSTSFDLINTTATTVNFAGAATSLNMGNASGTTTITGQAVIDTNTAGTALRVTQTGAGDAFRVEDETSPDSSPFVINSLGQVGIGTANPGNPLTVNGNAFFYAGSNNILLGTDGSIEILRAAGDPYIDFKTSSAQDYLVRLQNSGTNDDWFSITTGASGASRINYFSDAGVFKAGGTATRSTTEGDYHIDLFNGTAPAGTLTNGASLYCSSGEMYVMDASGNATQISPHDRETNEWIFNSKETTSGRRLKIKVEKLLKFINDHFGLDCVEEFFEEAGPA